MIKNAKILAPLSGINDIAFRLLSREYGADITYIGLVNAEAIVRGNKTTLDLIKTIPKERPVGIQLFGDNPNKISKAVKIVEPYADIIDFNFGCPSFKIIKQGYGAYLLEFPDKVEAIVKSLRQSTKKFLTIKMRAGLNDIDYHKALNIGKIIEKAGADALIIHPRSAKQGYSGKANWDLIAYLKKNLSIPIIGNGDIFKSDDIKRMYEITKCDAVMIGRGALGNPFIFQGKDNKSITEIREAFMKYLKYAKEFNITKNFAHIKMHALFFFKGFEGSSKLRLKLSKTKDLNELEHLIKEIK